MGKFVVVYFEDILIYSLTEEEHLGHLRKVIKELDDNDLLVNLKKCTFLTIKLLFLGYIVSSDGFILAKQGRFGGNFKLHSGTNYQLFEKGPFQWTKEAEESFKIIIQKLKTTPVLSLPNFDKVFVLECDACGTGIGAILLQEGRPVAFHSFDSFKELYASDKDFGNSWMELETKQHRDWVFSTWMAFGGNTQDLGSFGEETDKTTGLHLISERIVQTLCEDGVCRHNGRSPCTHLSTDPASGN
ncbi:transposon ty3-I gag-pol polyprotein [Tanacetum coccineum]